MAQRAQRKKRKRGKDPSAEERLEALEKECEELREKWMRSQADYQNLRRRSQSEHALELKRSMLPLLEELLLVLDYLDMALAATPSTEEARNLAVGVEMTRGKLVQALEREEVAPIPTDGTFDPELHEAARTEKREGAEPGTILETIRRGYTWRGGVLRHAHVVVAAAEEEGDEEPDEEKTPDSGEAGSE